MRAMLRTSTWIALASSVTLLACGDDSATGTGSGGGGGGAQSLAIDAPADTWTWVDFPESQCMTGTPFGIGINPSSTSDEVMIFFEGGNACFNLASCAVTANKDGYDATTFAAEPSITNRYFDRADPSNSFKDMSFIYVPYCSGDLHFGDIGDVNVGNKVRQFRGAANTAAFLKRIVPTFPDATKVVVTGVSAGGFGAALNYDQVATAFGAGVDAVLIDDSGPPMADAYIPPCLQKHLVETWGYEQSLCAECLGPNKTFAEEFVTYLTGKYPTASLALISSDEDETISQLLGFGENDCVDLDAFGPPPYDPAKYTAGLVDLRDRVAAGTSFRLYLIESTEHVWLDNDTTTVDVAGVTLHDWIGQALSHDAAWANVPAN